MVMRYLILTAALREKNKKRRYTPTRAEFNGVFYMFIDIELYFSDGNLAR